MAHEPSFRPVTAARVLLAATGTALACSAATLAQGDPLSQRFPSVIDAGRIDGDIGFRVVSQDGGIAWIAGDVNGDGIDDLVVGERAADPSGIDQVRGGGGCVWPSRWLPGRELVGRS